MRRVSSACSVSAYGSGRPFARFYTAMGRCDFLTVAFLKRLLVRDAIVPCCVRGNSPVHPVELVLESLHWVVLGTFQSVLNGLICIVNVRLETAVNPLLRLNLRFSEKLTTAIDKWPIPKTGV